MTDTVLRARPTTYNGIEMRSRLEARVAGFLDEAGLAWEYEPRAYASGREQYLPDFELTGIADPLGVERRWFLEIKADMPEYAKFQQIAKRMAVILTADPMAGLLIAEPAGLERSLYLTTTGPFAMLMRCQEHGKPFFAMEFGRTWAGRCGRSCDGTGWRTTDDYDPRLVMAKWDA